jgi:hypothetical protein
VGAAGEAVVVVAVAAAGAEEQDPRAVVGRPAAQGRRGAGVRKPIGRRKEAAVPVAAAPIAVALIAAGLVPPGLRAAAGRKPIAPLRSVHPEAAAPNERATGRVVPTEFPVVRRDDPRVGERAAVSVLVLLPAQDQAVVPATGRRLAAVRAPDRGIDPTWGVGRPNCRPIDPA